MTTDRGESYRRFFQTLTDAIEEYGFINNRRVGTKSSCDFRTEHGAWLTYTVDFALKERVWAGLYMGGRKSDAERNIRLFKKLKGCKDDIESRIGQSLEWHQRGGITACRIVLARSGSIDDDDDTLAEIREWMVENLLNFKRVFDPYLKELVGTITEAYDGN